MKEQYLLLNHRIADSNLSTSALSKRDPNLINVKIKSSKAFQKQDVELISDVVDKYKKITVAETALRNAKITFADGINIKQ